jgi:hypothetical protein
MESLISRQSSKIFAQELGETFNALSTLLMLPGMMMIAD